MLKDHTPMKLTIKVKPSKGKQEIVKEGDIYLISLKSIASEGKANAELLKLLKKEMGKQFKIIKGFNSRDKILEEIK